MSLSKNIHAKNTLKTILACSGPKTSCTLIKEVKTWWGLIKDRKTWWGLIKEVKSWWGLIKEVKTWWSLINFGKQKHCTNHYMSNINSFTIYFLHSNLGCWEPKFLVPNNMLKGSPQNRVTRLRSYAVTRMLLYK